MFSFYFDVYLFICTFLININLQSYSLCDSYIRKNIALRLQSGIKKKVNINKAKLKGCVYEGKVTLLKLYSIDFTD